MEATARGEEAAAAGELKSRLAEKAQAPRDIGHVYKKKISLKAPLFTKW